MIAMTVKIRKLMGERAYGLGGPDRCRTVLERSCLRLRGFLAERACSLTIARAGYPADQWSRRCRPHGKAWPRSA
jgi:hypothetical protein